jgi:signal transduction histidine kinase
MTLNLKQVTASKEELEKEIEERKRAEVALRESEEKFWQLFSRMPSGVAIYEAVDDGEDFVFRDFNIAGEAIEHIKKEEVIGKRVTEVFPGVKEFGAFSIFQRVWRTGKPEYFPSAVYWDAHDPGTWRESWIYRLPTGEIVAIYNDVTERKMGEMALHKANKQLNLLSDITRHDILNQLLVLRGYLELSHDVIDKPEALKEYIKKEQHAAITIEEQITFTRDYQNLGVSASAWQNVNARIRNAMVALPLRAVHIEPDPADPEVYADPLFEKVFYNLIDNALRYGGDQMKTIRVSSQESDTSLVIVCEDDGVGITVEDKKKLFRKGFGKHTGLGLFLSREILAITGITITGNGVPGKGARFEITVPKGAYRFTGTGGK